jgi:hypothetical protein
MNAILATWFVEEVVQVKAVEVSTPATVFVAAGAGVLALLALIVILVVLFGRRETHDG